MPATYGALGLLAPVGGDFPQEYRLAITQHAELLGNGPLAPVVASTSMTAAPFTEVIAAGGVTVTLPAATAGTLIGVVGGSTATASTVSSSGGALIYGVGISALGKTTFPLSNMTGVLLLVIGTAWYIVSGQQDTGWVALTLASGIVASGAPTATPAARLRGDKVELSGTLNTSSGSWASSTTFATVPTSMIPQYSANFTFAADTPTTGNVGEAGGAQPGQLQTASATFTVCSLDGLRYRIN